MSIEMIRGLYEYHWWANHRLFEVAVALGDETMGRNVGTQFSVPSLKGMFAHLYGADFMWLSRWKGTSPDRLPDDTDFPSVAALRTRWAELEQEQRVFVQALTESDLTRPVSYKDTRGKPYTLPLWPLLQHVANHATHHRSEIATMLTMVSGSPPDTGINSFWVRKTGQG